MHQIGNYSDNRYIIGKGKGDIIGKSPEMLHLFELVNALAGMDINVLIQGETGTGKELLAKALHYNGKRFDSKFRAINCASIPPELLESELFGYRKGAFTGAYANRLGLLQSAQGGTIFLDEIGDMSMHLQAKILRVIQEREVVPLGSETPEPLDIRVISATNKSLKEEIRGGRFRDDLFYRLNEYPLYIPSLRERAEDIPLLAKYFLNNSVGYQEVGFSPEAELVLRHQDWKGNVRELEAVIKRAVVHRNISRRDGPIEEYELRACLDTGIQCETIRETVQESNHVLPVSSTQFTRYITSLTHYYNCIRKGSVYSEKLSGREAKNTLIFLDLQAFDRLFRKPSENALALKQLIVESDFTRMARRPFAFYFPEALQKKRFALSDLRLIHENASRVKAYRVYFGRRYAFALNLDNYSEFARAGRQNRNLLRSEILERHDNFLSGMKWLSN